MNSYKKYMLVPNWQGWTVAALYFVKLAKLKLNIPEFSSLFGSLFRLAIEEICAGAEVKLQVSLCLGGW